LIEQPLSRAGSCSKRCEDAIAVRHVRFTASRNWIKQRHKTVAENPQAPSKPMVPLTADAGQNSAIAAALELPLGACPRNSQLVM
jgi:hypothetical protein